MSVCRIIIAIGLFLAFTVQAQLPAVGYDQKLFQDLKWRSIGPFRGGRVLAVTGVPGEPQHFYFGAVNGGIWETHDSGRTWQPIFDDQPVGSIGAIAVAPSNPKILYAGTGESDMRSDISQGEGVFRSDDGGKTWTQRGLVDSQQIAKVLIDPRNPDVVFVAALGHPYGSNEERGVFKSIDGGLHWQKVLYKDNATGAIDLVFEPGNPQVIYAGLWQTRRTPWSIYPPSSGPGGGLYKSIDGGAHWTQLKGNGFADRTGRIGLTISAAEPQRVYVLVDGKQGGLYRSDDAGAHWTHTTSDARIWNRGWYFGQILADPHNADRVYALNTIVLRTDDGGKSFNALKGDMTGDDFHDMWIDPSDSSRQILGVDQGTIISQNGGQTWSSWHNQPTAQIYRVSTDNGFPYRVYGAQQDSGAVSLPSRTTSVNGIAMSQFRETTAGGESNMIAPDPNDPQIIYGGTVDKLNLRTEQTRSITPRLAWPDNYRSTWTLPLVFSRRDSKVLYFSHQRVFRTQDGGEHWTPISPDLTREDPGVPANLDADSAANTSGLGKRRGVVYAIAPSRLVDHDIWVGTDDGLIWRTRDEGANWKNITPAALTAWSKVTIMDTSHFDAETAYAAIDRHRLEDRQPYIYRTRDGGASWQLIVSGIPDGAYVNVVREDSVRQGLLYAGTEKGVFVSFDDGEHWQALKQNLPATSVRDIDVHDNDLVIATHGRGFWIMDDVSILRQFKDEIAKSEAWLFEPAQAIRLRPEGFAGTPLPKEEPMAANPPDGAVIDYFLKSDSNTPVTLEILDDSGQRVRFYSSADTLPALDASKLPIAPEWVTRPVVLSATAGMHRFVWPMRYAPAAGLTDGDAYADGVWAPMGRYTLVLSTGSKALQTILIVKPDPRVKLDNAAYVEQFSLARRIEAEQAKLALMSNEAKAWRKALVNARDASSGATQADILGTLTRLDELIGRSRATNVREDGIVAAVRTTTLGFVGKALDDLMQAVDGADANPTDDARDGFAKIQQLAVHVSDAWKQFANQEIVALNTKLLAAKLKPVSLQP